MLFQVAQVLILCSLKINIVTCLQKSIFFLQAGEIFFKYLKRFVSPMAKILHYKLHSTEWVLMIYTKSEEEIKSAYCRQRNKSKTADREKDLTETKRMLSEHFRMALSNYVKSCNHYLKRRGGLVLRRFQKYPITSEKNYKQEFDRICDLKFCNYQQIKEKYVANKELYDVDNLLFDQNNQPHVLRSGNTFYARVLSREKMPVELMIVWPNSNVLRKILNPPSNDNKNKNPPP